MDWTIRAASMELDIAEQTIVTGLKREKLHKGGRETGKDSKYTTKEIFTAIHGDLKAARTRKETANARISEANAALKEGSVIPKDEARRYIAATLGPVRELLISLPSAMAARVNPSDPQHARAELQSWSDAALRQCRERLPTQVPEANEQNNAINRSSDL